MIRELRRSLQSTVNNFDDSGRSSHSKSSQQPVRRADRVYLAKRVNQEDRRLFGSPQESRRYSRNPKPTDLPCDLKKIAYPSTEVQTFRASANNFTSNNSRKNLQSTNEKQSPNYKNYKFNPAEHRKSNQTQIVEPKQLAFGNHSAETNSRVHQSSVKSKLYLRMLMRLTEKFGRHSTTIVKAVLDAHLAKNPHIDSHTFQVVQEQVQAQIGNGPKVSSLRYSVDQRPKHKVPQPRTFYSPREATTQSIFSQEFAKDKIGEKKSAIDFQKQQHGAEEDRIKQFKDEYRRQFVDINFYGLQSKIKNPMTSPNWKRAVPNMKQLNQSLNHIDEQQKILKMKKLEQMLPPKHTELSPDEKLHKRQELLQKFRTNVNQLKTEGDPDEPNQGKFKHILVQSLQEGRRRNVVHKSTAPAGGIIELSEESPPSKYQRKSMREKKADNLWLALDRFRNAKAEEAELKDRAKAEALHKKYVTEVNDQLDERSKIKRYNLQMKLAENHEISRELQQYKVEMEQAKQKAEKKRKEILNMMLDNIKRENEKQLKEQAEDRSHSHLLNTRQILLMDQMEKLHHDRIQMKKKQDDQINIETMYHKKKMKQTEKKKERETANTVPFFERLREKTEELESQQRKSYWQKKEQQRYHAAYLDGECILNVHKIEDLAKVDEAKAINEMNSMHEATDKEHREKVEAIRKKEALLKSENKRAIEANEKMTLRAKNLQRQKEFQGDSSPVFATIKLPEIMGGADDIGKMKKMKQEEFRKCLEVSSKKAQQNHQFLGMTEEEIMMNKNEFQEMGLF